MFEINCLGVGKTFHSEDKSTNRVALSNLNALFPAGKISAVIGESGCGKTTLLRILAGLVAPDSGAVHYRDVSTSQNRSPKIAMVFQEPRLFPWLTVEENIALAVRDLPEKERKARVHETLSVVGLAERNRALVNEISGGMAQRAGFARALVSKPDILFLDEAFSALDALTRDRLRNEFVRIWHARPMTVVLVTHDVWEAVLLSDTVFKLSAGKLNEVAQIDAPYPRRMDAAHLAHKAAILLQSFFGAKD